MGDFDKHHFIPRFFLSAWHSGSDKRLSRMSWINNRFHVERKSAKSAARQLGLYSIESGVEPNLIEEKFFRHLDSDAAVVHQKLTTGNALSLTPQDRVCWSAFLVSLMLRTPKMIRQIRKAGEEALLKEMDRDAEEYDALRDGTAPETLRALFEQLFPTLPKDFGVITLPAVVNSEKLNGVLLSSHWKIITLPAMCRRTFVLGDRPLIYNGTMATSYLISLPISPRQIFFSFNRPKTGENLDRTWPHRMIRNLNVAAARLAERHVFAADDREAHIVQSNLGLSERGYRATVALPSSRW